MTKKAVWNKDNEELLTKLLNMGATSAQASEEIYNKFDMVFSRNSIISKAKRLKIEFVIKPGNKYVIGTVDYAQTYKIKKADNQEFTKAWNNNVKVYELEQMFGIKRRSIFEKARRLKLSPRNVDKKFQSNLKLFSLEKDPTKKIPPITFNRTKFPNPQALGLKFLEVQRNQCHFILGHEKTADFLYCAAPVDPESPVPYCPTCRAIVYVKPSVSIHKIQKLFR